jgi:hypothetical protein
MKKVKLISIKYFVFALLISLAACEGDKGDVGPAGPAGPTGATGATGNANAKVQTFTGVTWTISAPGYYCSMTDADITQDMVDNGTIMVYLSNGSGGWIALPYTIPINSTYSSTFTPVHYLNGVTVWKYDTDYTQAVDPGPKTFKVVVIAGHSPLPIGLNLTNYDAVKAAFNLAD